MSTGRQPIDAALLSFAFPSQRPIVEAVIKHGGTSAAARALGKTRTAVKDVVRRVRMRAAKQGYAPDHDMTKTAPEGFHVKGVSTLYNAAGEVAAQWVKTNADRERALEDFREAVEGMAEPIRGSARPTTSKRGTERSLLACYPIGDSHFGMRSWAQEVGVDFDLAIAERNIVDSIDALVDIAPPARVGLLANMGDMTDADNASNQTPKSGNVLDADSRRPKVLRTVLRCLRRCIDRMLTKHEIVEYIGVEGNHDQDTAFAITVALELYYEREKRVIVHSDSHWWHWRRHGACLLGFNHGDECKPEQAPLVMACDRPKDWGDTTERHLYLGHVHHAVLRDFPGCTVESLRATAPNNAWSYRKGFRSKQTLRLDVWDAKEGLVDQYHKRINFPTKRAA